MPGLEDMKLTCATLRAAWNENDDCVGAQRYIVRGAESPQSVGLAEGARVVCCHISRVPAFGQGRPVGLASQVRRSAQSIRANITEGCSRPTNRDFARFLQIAIASASELEDHLEFARDVDLLKPNEANPLLIQVVEVRRMLYALLKRVQDDGGD